MIRKTKTWHYRCHYLDQGAGIQWLNESHLRIFNAACQGAPNTRHFAIAAGETERRTRGRSAGIVIRFLFVFLVIFLPETFAKCWLARIFPKAQVLEAHSDGPAGDPQAALYPTRLIEDLFVTSTPIIRAKNGEVDDRAMRFNRMICSVREMFHKYHAFGKHRGW